MISIGPWDAAVVIVKAVTYAATLGASGAVMFLIYSDALVGNTHGRPLRGLILVLSIVAALASGAKILATAASMSGDATGLIDLSLVRMVMQAGEGRAVMVRLGGLLLIGGMAAAYRPPPVPRPPVPLKLTAAAAWASPGRRRSPLPALVGASGAVVAATSFAWVGHVHALAAGSGAGSGLAAIWLPTLVLAMHLSAAAFWLGALLPLHMVAVDAEAAQVAAAAARFGAAALYVVGALLTAGACLLALLLHHAEELWASDYGRLMLAKLFLVGCLLALAALNHLRLTPRLLARDAAALRALRRSIRAELILAGALLLVTAALTTLVGPEPG